MTKKLSRLVLTGALAAALVAGTTVSSMPVLAADNGTITIDNAFDGQTYTVYKILNYAGTDKGGTYKAEGQWVNFFKGTDAQKVFTIDSNNVVSTKGTPDAAAMEAFSQAALTYAEKNKIAATASQTETKDGSNGSVKFTNLGKGYFLVNTTTGTLLSLNTATPDMTVKDKNDVPTRIKEVQEDSTNKYGKSNDAEVGQVVNYKTTINAKKGAQGYVYSDEMSAGLTYNEDVKVTVAGKELTAGTDYTVSNSAVKLGFDVTFNQKYLDTITGDTDIVLDYSATINQNAVYAPAANTNDQTLQYGNKNRTVKQGTKTYVYQFDVHKYGSDVNVLLDGAHFNLYRGEATYDDTKSVDENVKANAENVINLVKVDDSTYRVATKDDKNTTTDIVTVKDKDIRIEGLDADPYSMIETQAPDGYNTLNKVVDVTVTAAAKDGTYSVANAKAGEVPVEQIQNQSGSLLPTTGGIGTTIFKVVGGALILVAAVYFVIRRKKIA